MENIVGSYHKKGYKGPIKYFCVKNNSNYECREPSAESRVPEPRTESRGFLRAFRNILEI